MSFVFSGMFTHFSSAYFLCTCDSRGSPRKSTGCLRVHSRMHVCVVLTHMKELLSKTCCPRSWFLPEHLGAAGRPAAWGLGRRGPVWRPDPSALRSTGSLFSLLRPLTGGLRPRPHGRGHLLHLGPGCGGEPRAQKALTATSRRAEALWGPSRPSGPEGLTVTAPVGLVPFQKPNRCSRRLLPGCPKW